MTRYTPLLLVLVLSGCASPAGYLKAAGCEVINCTPGSALTVWPMSTIEKELG